MSKSKEKLELNKSLTEKELQSLKDAVGTKGHIENHILKVELEKHNLMKIWDEAEAEIAKIKNELRDKYGDVNINMQDGSITKMEKDATNKKG